MMIQSQKRRHQCVEEDDQSVTTAQNQYINNDNQNKNWSVLGENPKSQEKFLGSVKFSTIYMLGFILFCIALMVTGILIVCFTASDKQNDSCTNAYVPKFIGNIELNPHPRSLDIGDVDHDKNLDIVTANYGANNIAILLGYGNGTFASPKIFSTGIFSRPTFVAVVDTNNDTHLDILVAAFGINAIGVFLGIGNATFSDQNLITTKTSRPISMTFGDFNTDRLIDIVVANYGTDSVGILLGLGNGTFLDAKNYFIGYDSDPRSVAATDLNSDTKLDIVVANSGTNSIGILLGSGDGTFRKQKLYSTGYASLPHSIAIGDLNKDNQIDIIVANSGGNNVGIFFGYGNGLFHEQSMLPTGSMSQPNSVVVEDFNHDYMLDIAVVNSQAHLLCIFFGYGNGSFQIPKTFSTGYDSEPVFLIAKDMNKDTLQDIIIANNGTNTVSVFIFEKSFDFRVIPAYLTLSINKRFILNTPTVNREYVSNQVIRQNTSNNNRNALFARSGIPMELFYHQCYALCVNDINNDNELDLVSVSGTTNRMAVMLGSGNGAFTLAFQHLANPSYQLCSTAVGYFNDDIHLDLVLLYRSISSFDLFLGYGNGSFVPFTRHSTSIYFKPSSVAITDFNHDNKTDIVLTSWESENVILFFGYGNGSFMNQMIHSTGSRYFAQFVLVKDFNNDNNMDIATVCGEKNALGIFFGQSNGSFANQFIYSTGERSFPYSLATGDFNNDSNIDIAVANYGLNIDAAEAMIGGESFSIAVFLNFGNGSFAPAVLYSTGYMSLTCSISTADFNQDNKLDIVVANSAAQNLGIFLGNGDGTFALQIIFSYTGTFFPIFLRTGDFNNDKLEDIVVYGIRSTTLLSFLNYNVISVKVQSFEIAQFSRSYSLCIADFNRDHNLDIALSNAESNTISLLFGYGNMNFSAKQSFSVGSNSYPIFMISADVNNDNALDMVAVNSGSNSIGVLYGYGNGSFHEQVNYQTDIDSRPMSAIFAYFNNDTQIDIAVANSGSDSIVLYFGINVGKFEKQIRFLNSENNPFYALAFGDFNSDSLMDTVVINRVTKSVDVLLQSDNGVLIRFARYPYRMFPSSVTVGDFNHDFKTDIVVTGQGSSTSGGMEGIFVYFGCGNGTFEEYMFYPSDLIIGPSSVCIADFDNDHAIDIAVANEENSNIGIFFGYRNGSFENQMIYSTGYGSTPSSIAVGDINYDKQMDIVVTNSRSDSVGVFLGYGNRSFANQMTYSTGSDSGPQSVVLIDLNHDNRIDIVAANKRSTTIGILFGYGNGSFSSPITYLTGSEHAPILLSAADINNDERIDIVVIYEGSTDVGIFLGIGHGLLARRRQVSTNSLYYPTFVTCFDWNKDNQSEIIIVDATHIFAFIQSFEHGFVEGTTLTTGNNSFPKFLNVEDLNNDRQQDIIITNTNADCIGIFLGYGNGRFAQQITYNSGLGSKPYSTSLADLNSDNQIDIVVVNYGSNSIGVWFGCGNGTFFQTATYSTGVMSYPTSVELNDLNKDGYLDIISVNSGSDNILILFGSANGTFVQQRTISMGYGAEPISIAYGDINNDNWTDIVVVNYGFKNIAVVSPICFVN